MKKKLLTVLLAVVMVFGVFSLTACGAGTNPDSEYNYYGTKYELDGDVKIEAATFQGVYKMFTTAGNFLLYVDSESSGAAARFQAINKLAQDWNVTIYHFNPDLTGGYDTSVNANILLKLEGEAATSQLTVVQSTLSAISQKPATEWTDNTLYGISGAESTNKNGVLTYNGKIAGSASYKNGAVAIASVALRRPSYAQYAQSGNTAVPEAYNTGNINTMNLFADNRLHMYNDDGTDALTEEKTDVYVTVANYGQFAYLMDNNEGYFAVFFGGTWCPNTQAIAMLTNDLAKDYGIERIYFFDPRLEDGTKIDAASGSGTADDPYVVVENSAYLASNLNSRNSDIAGMWETNKRSLAKAMVDALVDAGKEIEYAANATFETFTGIIYDYIDEVAADNSYLAGATSAADVATKMETNYIAGLNTKLTYNYAHVYAKFLKAYLPEYSSEWNYGVEFIIGGESYTKMCVPNMMMFNGEGQGKAKLVGLAEAEYTYANTSVEGNPQNVEWTNAIKAIFDKDPYAYYAPLPEPVEETATATTGGTSSAPATSAPAADAGGC